MTSGKGIFVQADGGTYEGEFKNDKSYGKGKFISADKKLIYEGEFGADMQDGTGSETKIGVYKFTGSFKNRKKNGKGEMTWLNGQTYSGMWKDGNFDGEGILQTNDYRYEGKFSKGKPHGFGTFSWQDGRVYKG